MISVLISTRVGGNSNSNLRRLLDSCISQSSEHERTQVEFLIKADNDDKLFDSSFFKSYPFPVRPCWSNRCEGRNSLHHFYEFLLGRIDQRSRWIMVTSDDFVYHRGGWISEVLSMHDEIAMIEVDRPIDLNRWTGEKWRLPEHQHDWRSSTNMCSPIMTRKLIEITSGFGFIPCTDTWCQLLSLLLYEDYGINIRKLMAPFYARNEVPCRTILPDYPSTSWLAPDNMDYWYELVRRQARNIYLNLKFGTEYKRV